MRVDGGVVEGARGWMAERWTADGGWWVVGCAVGPDCALSFESVAPVSAIFWRVDSAVFSGLGTCGLASTSTPTSTRQALGRRKEQKHRMQSPPRQI